VGGENHHVRKTTTIQNTRANARFTSHHRGPRGLRVVLIGNAFCRLTRDYAPRSSSRPGIEGRSAGAFVAGRSRRQPKSHRRSCGLTNCAGQGAVTVVGWVFFLFFCFFLCFYGPAVSPNRRHYIPASVTPTSPWVEIPGLTGSAGGSGSRPFKAARSFFEAAGRGTHSG